MYDQEYPIDAIDAQLAVIREIMQKKDQLKEKIMTIQMNAIIEQFGLVDKVSVRVKITSREKLFPHTKKEASKLVNQHPFQGGLCLN